jgi:hypothetical protein
MATSSALDWIIPTILVLIVLGWVWLKLLQPFVFPMLAKWWEWARGAQQNIHIEKQREITYE